MNPAPSAPTLGTALARAAQCPHRGVTFVDRRERELRLSWPQIHARARVAAGALAAAGIDAGERVALVYPTGPEFLDAFFGCVLAGAVPVPLYPPVRLGRLAEYHQRTAALLVACGARLVLADRRVGRLLGEAVEAARPELGLARLEELPAGRAPLVTPGAGDLALVQFSSGTTVDPKPVALCHRAVMAQAATLNGFWPDGPGVTHSGFSWLPLYHDMGLVGCLFAALERPGDLTLLPPELFAARPALWLRGIGRSGATISPAPNFAYALCLEKVRDEEMAGVDLSRWRVALNGAEAVAPAVLRAFARRFARWGFRAAALTPVYGLSEACLAVTFSPLGEPFTAERFDRAALARGVARADPAGRELAAVGRPLPGFRVEVRDASRRPLPAGRAGRVWVAGPSLMEGYLGRPRETARVLVGGWLDTGDLGFFHGDQLYLTGRARDVIVLRGANHPPEEIEAAVAGLPGLRSGCVAAVGFLPEGGEREALVLLVERAREASDAAAAALPERCREAVLAATALDPDQVVVLSPGTLPRTSSGKIRRGEALARYRAGRLDPPAPVSALRLAGAMARSRLALGRARRVRARAPEEAGGR